MSVEDCYIIMLWSSSFIMEMDDSYIICCLCSNGLLSVILFWIISLSLLCSLFNKTFWEMIEFKGFLSSCETHAFTSPRNSVISFCYSYIMSDEISTNYSISFLLPLIINEFFFICTNLCKLSPKLFLSCSWIIWSFS